MSLLLTSGVFPITCMNSTNLAISTLEVNLAISVFIHFIYYVLSVAGGQNPFEFTQ